MRIGAFKILALSQILHVHSMKIAPESTTEDGKIPRKIFWTGNEVKVKNSTVKAHSRCAICKGNLVA